MSGRSLSTLSLPLSTLSALSSAGYETVHDLSSSTPEQLSKGSFLTCYPIPGKPTYCASYSDLNLPLPASQAVFSATRASAALPLTQSAAAMMGATKRYSTACAPLDKLLGGGLRRGSVLELMGPAGCGKEQLATHAVKTFVEANQEVLFVGTTSDRAGSQLSLSDVPAPWQTCRTWRRPPPSRESCPVREQLNGHFCAIFHKINAFVSSSESHGTSRRTRSRPLPNITYIDRTGRLSKEPLRLSEGASEREFLFLLSPRK